MSSQSLRDRTGLGGTVESEAPSSARKQDGNEQGEDGVKPEDAKTAPWSEEKAQAVIHRHKGRRGALLPLLHELQETFGYIDGRAVPPVAEALCLSKAEVEGVISFYKDFRRTAPGRHVVAVCRAEACQAVGAEGLVAHLQSKLSLTVDGTSADGAFTLDTVYCLGNCALGPSLTIDGVLHGRVTAERADKLIGDAGR